MTGYVNEIDWINAEAMKYILFNYEPKKYYFEALKYCINIYNSLLLSRGEMNGFYIYNKE